MAKHSKAKRKARKKQPCSSEAGNKAAGARTTSSAISEFEYVHQQQEEEQLPAHSEDRVAAADVQSNETQTEGKYSKHSIHYMYFLELEMLIPLALTRP